MKKNFSTSICNTVANIPEACAKGVSQRTAVRLALHFIYLTYIIHISYEPCLVPFLGTWFPTFHADLAARPAPGPLVWLKTPSLRCWGTIQKTIYALQSQSPVKRHVGQQSQNTQNHTECKTRKTIHNAKNKFVSHGDALFMQFQLRCLD